MLHIFLLILKIIGWVLLAILGLFVLLLCVAVFVPLRYKGEMKSLGTLDSLYGKVRFSWLLHLIAGYVVYENGKTDWQIRILWKKFSDTQELPYKKTDDGQSEAVSEEEQAIEVQKTAEPQRIKQELEEQQPDAVAEAPAKEGTLKGDTVKEETSNEKPYKKELQNEVERGEKESFFERIENKITEVIKKIKYTFQKICGTIKSIAEKKDKLLAFLSDEVHKTAFFLACKELKRFLYFLKPKRFTAYIHFGFSDPSITGRVLAAACMLSPFLGEDTDIQPDFDKAILEGEACAAGKIRLLYVVIPAWNLFWSKHVRVTYRHIRKFKL